MFHKVTGTQPVTLQISDFHRNISRKTFENFPDKFIRENQ